MPTFDEHGNYSEPLHAGPEVFAVYGKYLDWWSEDPAFSIKKDFLGRYRLVDAMQPDHWHLVTASQFGFRCNTTKPPWDPIMTESDRVAVDYDHNGLWTVSYERKGNQYSYYDAGTHVELRIHHGPHITILTRIRNAWKDSDLELNRRFLIEKNDDLDTVDFGLLVIFQIAINLTQRNNSMSF